MTLRSMQNTNAKMVPSVCLLEGYELKKGEVNVDDNYRKGFKDFKRSGLKCEKWIHLHNQKSRWTLKKQEAKA